MARNDIEKLRLLAWCRGRLCFHFPCFWWKMCWASNMVAEWERKVLVDCKAIFSNKEGDSVSPSGYRATVMTTVYSRIAQTPITTPRPTRRPGRPVQLPLSTTPQPITSPQPAPSSTPTTASKRPQTTLPPERPAALTTTGPPSQSSPKPSGPLNKPRRPTNTSIPKTFERMLWFREKLESVGGVNQIYKKPNGGKSRAGKRPRAGSVRLVSADGLSDRGRVEIFIRGEWGTVCDDLFTSKSGTVVCRQLGFTKVLAVMKRAALGEANGSVRILLDDVECEGGERSLLLCRRSKVGKHNCSHGEDVGVICG